MRGPLGDELPQRPFRSQRARVVEVGIGALRRRCHRAEDLPRPAPHGTFSPGDSRPTPDPRGRSTCVSTSCRNSARAACRPGRGRRQRRRGAASASARERARCRRAAPTACPRAWPCRSPSADRESRGRECRPHSRPRQSSPACSPSTTGAFAVHKRPDCRIDDAREAVGRADSRSIAASHRPTTSAAIRRSPTRSRNRAGDRPADAAGRDRRRRSSAPGMPRPAAVVSASSSVRACSGAVTSLASTSASCATQRCARSRPR